MKSKLLISVFLLTALMGFKGEDWSAFKTEAFSIDFPAQPKAETKKINSAIGELTMNIYSYDASKSSKNDDNIVYMVMSTEYPDSVVNSDNKENLAVVFKNGIDGAVKNVHGKLLAEKAIEIDGFPGREIKIDVKDGVAIIKMRFYLVKNKMYMIQLITETAKELNNSADRFINSFKLIR